MSECMVGNNGTVAQLVERWPEEPSRRRFDSCRSQLASWYGAVA